MFSLYKPQTYSIEKFNAELQTTVESLQNDHKAAIEKLAGDWKSQENESVENRKELEQHFEAFIQQLQDKLQVGILNDIDKPYAK